jgi:O-antigen/teichoic acid export membrane protein
MSRFRRIIHGTASGYVSLITASIYSLASVPLALHYLSRERFALWALMATIWGYLSLIDFGMSGSVARLLIDHKDDRERGVYGSLIKTGWLVLAIQGLLIWSAGFVLAPVLSHLLAIPDSLRVEFISLMRWQISTLAFSFVMRIFSHILLAHQRIDLINYNEIIRLVAGYFMLWGFFHAGQGIFSLVWSQLIGAFAGVIAWWANCWWLRLFPPAGAWGRVSWDRFRELFGFGKSLFLVAVGTQLIVASQLMIITRRLGLETAALWAVGTRVFSLMSQIIWRVFDVSTPALAEMIVHGENRLLRERYRDLFILSVSFSGFCAVSFALCNSSFVAVWTGFTWPRINDTLLGIWMIVLAIIHCHNGFILNAKQVGAMPYVYLAEGLAYVVSAFVAARVWGLPGVIACSIACSIAFSCAYGVRRISGYFNLPVREVAWHWLVPMARVLLLFAPPAVAAGWALRTISDPLLRLAAGMLLCVVLGFYLFLRYGLSRSFQVELLARAPRAINPVLRRVFVAPAQ